MSLAALTTIRCVLCDVDGVLTSGSLPFTAAGQIEKSFSVRDGLVIRYAQRAGISVGVISGRASEATEKRCRDLDMSPLHLGVGAKGPVFQQILTDLNVRADEVAFIGDDYPDLDVMTQCGWGVAVADASAGVKRQADWVCTTPGGQGAVAEALERILRAQGQWTPEVSLHG